MTQTLTEETSVSSLLAAQVLDHICTRDELEDILRRRGVGLYGRLRKWEMARAVAGDEPEEVFAADQIRQKVYRTNRQRNQQQQHQ